MLVSARQETGVTIIVSTPRMPELDVNKEKVTRYLINVIQKA